MMTEAKRRWWVVAAVLLLVVLIGGGIVGFRMALGIIKGKVVEALGQGSEITAIRVGWSSVEVVGLRIKGPQGWPAAETLRAERVVIVPSLRSLLSDQIRIGSITVVRPYLSMLRTREGKLRVVPSLLERAPAKGQTAAGPPTRSAAISRIELEDGVVELFDATVAQPPLKIRLEKLQASARNVLVPTLTGKSEFDMVASVKGVQRDGRARVTGWLEAATKDSSVKTELRSVDLVAFQPYFSKASETRIQRGGLDMDLASEVSKNRLRAPGKLTISDLEFEPARGALDTFMGLPRASVVSFLKNRDNKISVNFLLEGDINNPQFTLNEVLATRIAASLAETLGLSIRGLAEGVGGLGRKGAEAVGETAKGLGGALRQLFGGQKQN